MARDFVERGTWREASRAELAEWLGHPGAGHSHESWPVPEELLPARTPAHDPSLVVDQARLVLLRSRWGVQLLLDSGVRGEDWTSLVRLEDPDGVEWQELADAAASAPGLHLLAAVVLGASEELTDLDWYAGEPGLLHDAALLRIRLVDDRAVAAWLELR